MGQPEVVIGCSMQCTNPYTVGNDENSFKVPCNKCISCKIAHSREWAIRILHESRYYDSSLFLTLTYNDESLPDNLSINKGELQRFFKRLRIKDKERNYKYFACGEYGDKYGRPHYHSCVFGMQLSDFKEKFINGKKYWYHDCWPNGIIHCGLVEYNSARYVADYVFKKYNGKLAYMEYERFGLEVPFQLCSQGIGLRYIEEHEKELRETLTVKCRGKKVGLPLYYKRKLGIDTERLIEKVDIKNELRLKKIREKGIIEDDDIYDDVLRENKQRNRNMEHFKEIKDLLKAEKM